MRPTFLVLLGLTLGATLPAASVPTPLGPADRSKLIRELALPDLPATALAGVTVVRDLEFARPADQPLRLDLYLPPAAATTRPVPCVLVIAGGGFAAQTRDRFGFVAAYLAAHGFAAASLDYRGAPEVRWLETVRDTKAAVRWLRAHAADHGFDPARIAALGQSAGGHLAAFLAVTGDRPDFEPVAPAATPVASTRIQAAVALAGVFDFVSRLRDGGQQSHQPKMLETKRRTNAAWIGEPFSPDLPVWRQASPLTHVAPGTPPLLLLHCRGDATVPFAQSEQMAAALRPVSPRSRLVLYDGGGHNLIRAAGIAPRAWEEIVAFLRTELTR